MERIEKAQRHCQTEHTGDRRPLPKSDASNQQRTDDEQGPGDVELLLCRKRPVVLDRGGGVRLGQVVDGVVSERPVLDVEGRGDDLAKELDPLEPGHPQVDPYRGGRQDDVGRWQQSPRAARPERSEPNSSVRLDLSQQVRRDQEPGDHEEGVDADVSAGQPLGPQMEQDHQGHRDSAETLDLSSASSLSDWWVALDPAM
jgi:hypothetical protein